MRSCDVISLLTQFAFCNHGFYRMSNRINQICWADVFVKNKCSEA